MERKIDDLSKNETLSDTAKPNQRAVVLSIGHSPSRLVRSFTRSRIPVKSADRLFRLPFYRHLNNSEAIQKPRRYLCLLSTFICFLERPRNRKTNWSNAFRKT